MDELLCGFSQAEITPEIPGTVYIDGYGSRLTPAEGVRDPLYVKVCAIRSGSDTFVIAAFDVCGFCHELKEKMRAAIREFTGLTDKQFAICATHTHAGPACGVLRHLPINGLYWNKVFVLAAEAVNRALESVCSGQFRFAFGNELTLAFNRRKKDIIDRRVPVCGFFDKEDKLRGIISSASCHPVCITDMYMSADYPSVMTKRAAEEYPGVPFLFLQGRGADIDPNFPDRDRVAMCSKLGGEFSDSVFAALDKMKGEGVAKGGIKSLYQTITVPMQYPSREKLESDIASKKKDRLEATADVEKNDAMVELLWHARTLKALEEGKKPSVEADLQMVSIGDGFGFAFVPFEMLTSTGNAVELIMSRFSFEPGHSFVIGYSNGDNGYLSPSAEFSEGDYETANAAYAYDLPSIYGPDSEITVLNALEDMADALV